MNINSNVPKVEVIQGEKNPINRKYRQEQQQLRVGAYCRVSTDSEEQAKSYQSQMKYYTDMIKEKSDWTMVKIYADEALSGTSDGKRLEFLNMINDCEKGMIDLIITKSISRFARNTVDTLKYVRRLKEIGVAVLFEEENINTLTMNGELLLTILSSVAQQEVENTSANVKKGLQMKMKRGELVGWNSCLGYDYDRENKSMSINIEEVETVKFIFKKYLEGYGCYSIAKMLEEIGAVTKKGKTEWHDTSVRGILKNEKYKGDILQGKTFTVDPISKRRLDNFGEEDMFYVKDHHEAIISNEDFDEVQRMMAERGAGRKRTKGMVREKHSRKYAFSSKLECGFCGGNLSRRSWNSTTSHAKAIWQCVTSTKKGKKYCEHAKGIPETIIENAFMKSYSVLCENKGEILDKFLATLEKALEESNTVEQIKQVESKLSKLQSRLSKLTELLLDEELSRVDFQSKYDKLKAEIKALEENLHDLKTIATDERSVRKRIDDMRNLLESNEFEEFDGQVFDSVIEKVIVGEITEDGEYNPYKFTFIYRTGIKNEIIPPYIGRLEKDKKECSYLPNEVGNLSSYISTNTRGKRGFAGKRRIFRLRSIHDVK